MADGENGQEQASPKDARLASLNERLDRIKQEEAEREKARMSRESQRVIKSAGMRILSDLIGMPLGAGIIGWFIDRAAGTTPWVMLVMLFLGFGLAVRSVLRVANQRSDETQGNE